MHQNATVSADSFQARWRVRRRATISVNPRDSSP
jgi:hypothetical protein